MNDESHSGEPATPDPPSASLPVPPAEGGEGIDLERLKAALNVEIKPALSAAPRHEETLEELADDLLHLLRRLQSVEQCQAAILTHLDQLTQQVGDGMQQLGQQIDGLACDVVGERKGLALVGLFNATLPALESLEALCGALDPNKDPAFYRQVAAVSDLLARLLRSLGLSEFRPALGQAFDPWSMACRGFAEGPAGVVLDVVRAGYKAGEQVIFPAAVRIADPTATENKQTAERSPSPA